MLGFIDESGDTGSYFGAGSSDYFVVSVVLFEDEEEVSKIEECIQRLKHNLRNPNMEFHFPKTSENYRLAFFEEVKGFSFNVFAVVMDKRQLYAQEGKQVQELRHEEFLKTCFGLAMNGAKSAGLLNGANLKFDDTGSSTFKKKLASTLLAEINKEEKGRYIKKFSPQKSKGNNLIQLADMVCGAIARQHSTSDEKGGDYVKLIKHRIVSVLKYP